MQLPTSLLMPAPSRAVLPVFTDRLPLGKSGLLASPFCIGITQPEVVVAAFDAGINFFFVTADMHWPIYEGTRRGLQELLERPGVRDQIVVASVVYTAQPEFCRAPFEEVCEAIPGLERIDVLVAGGAYSHDALTRIQDLNGERREGTVDARAIGMSFHDRKAAAQLAGGELLDISFVRYNSAHPGARGDLFPRLTGRSSPVFNFTTTSGFVAPSQIGIDPNEGYWQPEVSDHYRFALTRPELDGVLCAPRSHAELEALARAVEKGPLDPDEERFLVDLSDIATGAVELVTP